MSSGMLQSRITVGVSELLDISWSAATKVDATGVSVFLPLTPVEIGASGSPTGTFALSSEKI